MINKKALETLALTIPPAIPSDQLRASLTDAYRQVGIYTGPPATYATALVVSCKGSGPKRLDPTGPLVQNQKRSQNQPISGTSMSKLHQPERSRSCNRRIVTAHVGKKRARPAMVLVLMGDEVSEDVAQPSHVGLVGQEAVGDEEARARGPRITESRAGGAARRRARDESNAFELILSIARAWRAGARSRSSLSAGAAATRARPARPPRACQAINRLTRGSRRALRSGQLLIGVEPDRARGPQPWQIASGSRADRRPAPRGCPALRVHLPMSAG